MTEPARVLRLIARMNVGGPALQTTGLMRGMDPDRYQQLLVVGRREDAEGDYLALRAPDVTCTVLPGLRRSVGPVGDAQALAALLQLIRRYRPHIIHTHTAKAGVLGRAAASIARVPVRVHTFHGHLLHGYFSPAGTRAVVAVERRLARTTDALVSVGSQVRDELLAAGIGRADQYTVVPPGLDLGPVPGRLEARAALGLAPDAPTVGFVGRLVQVKRPDRFAAVARRIAAELPDAQFVVCGDGDERAATERLMAPLADRTRFLGWRADVELVHAACDVSVLTSDNEGMPVSLIEASMAGTPCVATDVGSVREVVLDGVTGAVVAPAEHELADAVLALLRDDARRSAFGHAAREHALVAFGRQRLVRDITEVYDAALAKRQGI